MPKHIYNSLVVEGPRAKMDEFKAVAFKDGKKREFLNNLWPLPLELQKKELMALRKKWIRRHWGTEKIIMKEFYVNEHKNGIDVAVMIGFETDDLPLQPWVDHVSGEHPSVIFTFEADFGDGFLRPLGRYNYGGRLYQASLF